MNDIIEQLRNENRMLSDENRQLKALLRTVRVEGWKGKDNLVITKSGTDWIIQEHRKDKATGEVGTNTHTIPEENVTNLWNMIKESCDVNSFTRYRKLIHSIILKYNLPIELEEFNGGTNRSKIYFPYYYYPMKVLENKGLIRYGGRGKVTRLIP